MQISYKRLGGLMVLLMVVLSLVPFVAADGDEDTRLRAENEIGIRNDHREANRETKQEARQDERSDNERPARPGKIVREAARETRETVQDVRASAREAKKEAYADAREHYQEAKQKFMEERSAFVESRDRWKACKDQEKTNACKQAKERMKGNTKPFLSKSADMVLEHLQRVRARIEAIEEMDDEAKANALAAIDARIQVVTDAKADVDALPDDASADQLKETATSIRDAWKDTKPVLKDSVGHAMVAKLGNIIHRVEKLQEKLDRIREHLQKKGKDVSRLDGMLVDFDAKLAAATTSYNEAKAIFAQAQTGEERSQAIKSAHDKIVEARTSLKEARDLLRQVVVEIRAKNKGKLEAENESDDDAAEGAPEADEADEPAVGEDVNAGATVEVGTGTTAAITTDSSADVSAGTTATVDTEGTAEVSA